MEAYSLGQHVALSMWVHMQDRSDVLMCCTAYGRKVPDNHRGHLHAAVLVVDNACRDNGGLEMLTALVAIMEDAAVAPADTQSTTSPLVLDPGRT